MTRTDSLKCAGPQAPKSLPPSTLVTSTTPTQSPKPPPSPSRKSPRNPSNKHWIHEQQRKTFLNHLAQWSLSHDSSPYFHGKIGLVPDSQVATEIGLAKSVACILTDVAFTDARKKIIVRLFPPQENKVSRKLDNQRKRRRDSMHPLDSELNFSEWQRCVQFNAGEKEENEQPQVDSLSTANRYYKLIVRCGAGWISAREYFSKLYFSQLEAQKRNPRTYKQTINKSLKSRSELLGPPPSDKDSVTIQPLFHPFGRLPVEIQEMILRTAAGHTQKYNLCLDPHLLQRGQRREPAPISLSTMFQISKAINVHLLPYVFHSTDFNFGLTGFTNFLWQCGPTNRVEIKRLTFHFGKLALLHCIRWLAPDPVFDLLEPPVVTNPRALQYFWRCQIQDLARELHLLSLTIDIAGIPTNDLPMVVCILRKAFGSIEHMRFVDRNKDGVCKEVKLSDETIRTMEQDSWRDMCSGYLERHRLYHYFYKWDLMSSTAEEYDALMDKDREFFGERRMEVAV